MLVCEILLTECHVLHCDYYVGDHWDRWRWQSGKAGGVKAASGKAGGHKTAKQCLRIWRKKTAKYCRQQSHGELLVIAWISCSACPDSVSICKLFMYLITVLFGITISIITTSTFVYINFTNSVFIKLYSIFRTHWVMSFTVLCKFRILSY